MDEPSSKPVLSHQSWTSVGPSLRDRDISASHYNIPHLSHRKKKKGTKMGWWRRMRNKMRGKPSARPVRYAGHIQHPDETCAYGRRTTTTAALGTSSVGLGLPPPTTTASACAPSSKMSSCRNYLRAPTLGRNRDGAAAPRGWMSSPPKTPPEKALIEESRFSSSLLRPSMMSDRSAYFQEMSFELPRR